MNNMADEYDVAVIGAGHAGCEAALAAAKLGCRVVLFAISLDSVANLPCNPSIGGSAKGQLVREIDALGGQMGKVADAATLQSRMLNRSKGPAVHSLRVQVDKSIYQATMKSLLEAQENLELKQAEICEIKQNSRGSVCAVVDRLKEEYLAKTVIICTGTYLAGRVYVGACSFSSGPDGFHASVNLASALRDLGVETRRFKTGTPARILKSSLDLNLLEEQLGDDKIQPFSFDSKIRPKNRIVCYVGYTNKDTHKIILDNLQSSPIYSGEINGVGPRYCPSIEDKVVRFASKKCHQFFVEPMGLKTQEMYIQGMSTSLPSVVQVDLYRSLLGFEKAQLMRVGYAIEYDCCNPLDLASTLEFKKIDGLFGAGQFNGTSGYEEAAAQGLIAGINAALNVQGREMLVLPRSSSYIGTLIDDLTIKGCDDPYRMLTSRSEYRLLLRHDNADERLMPIGYELGLIDENRWSAFQEKQQKISRAKVWLQDVVLPPGKQLDGLSARLGMAKITTGVRAQELLKRPEVSLDDLFEVDCLATKGKRGECDQLERSQLFLECDWRDNEEIRSRVEIETKYEGYIKRQELQAGRMKKAEQRRLNRTIDYTKIEGLRLEAREKLNRVKPETLGQAARISGVSPADIAVLLVWFAKEGEAGS